MNQTNAKKAPLVTAVSDQTFQKEVINSDLPVIVDFWAPWCGPCRMIGPILEELAQSYEGKIKILKVNVDENQAVAGSLGIQAIPTIAFFKGGQVKNVVVGLRPKQEIKTIIDELL